MDTTTTHILNPAYAAMIFVHFQFISRHDKCAAPFFNTTQKSSTTTADNPEIDIPVIIGVIDGAYEYDLWFDIDRSDLCTISEKYIGMFDNKESEEDAVYVAVSCAQGAYSGNIRGMARDDAQRLTAHLMARSLAEIPAIEDTYIRNHY